METTSGQDRLRARVWNLRAADPKKDLKTDLAGLAIKTRQTAEAGTTGQIAEEPRRAFISNGVSCSKCVLLMI
jgi:hypothetical protein